MGLMEVSGVGCNLFWMEREKLSDVKKLFNLIISFSLLYLVLCSIPHFHVISYMLLVIYLINQFP